MVRFDCCDVCLKPAYGGHMVGINFALEGIRTMRKVPVLTQLAILGVLSIAAAPCALADSVNAMDDIYAAGGQTVVGPLGVGNTPDLISISSGVTSYTFTASGTITINNGGGNIMNDADGQGSGVAPTSFNTGYGSISGLTAPGQGFLVGVFVDGSASGPAPASLNFTTGSGTAFTSLSPLIDQVFYIGDGMTGDGTGSVQTFYVPTGATELYLGISDAFEYGNAPYGGGFGSGAPGSYGDNVGNFDVTATAEGGVLTPEPSSLLLFGTGILGMAAMLRRKFQTK
jgi:hypothetical protein